MTGFLFIASREPSEGESARELYDLVLGLCGEGAKVTVFLVQNGVFPARRGVGADGLDRLTSAGVCVLADEFSLRERGIGDLRSKVQSAPIDAVIGSMIEGWKVLWN